MSCAGDESGTVRHLTLSRSDTRVRVDVEERNLFCIRLHFVLEERIGVEKISAERFLTIDEAACRHVFAGRNLRRRNPGRQDFATTANTMTISRHGSHRKLLAETAVIGLAHRGHVMRAER